MTNISLDLSNKIPLQTIRIIELVNTVVEELGLPVFLVGATARDIVLEYGYGLPKSEATRDIDFGVAIGSWADYERLKQELIKNGKIQPDLRIEHRFFDIATGTEIDIIPFGGIETSGGEIRWQESGRKMNMAGFNETFDTALDVKLSKSLTMKIVSPVGLAILKIISWNDRCSNKDSRDFWLVAKNYLDIGNNEDCIFENYSHWLEEVDYDNRVAGARLLGIDIAHICSERTVNNILHVLGGERRLEKFVLDIARLENRFGDQFESIRKIIEAIKTGIMLKE